MSYNQEVPTKHPIPWRLIFVTVGAVFIAVGVSYYSWNLRGAHIATQNQLRLAQDKSALNEAAHDKLTQCTADKENLTERCGKVAQSVKAIEGDLSATRSELELLRQQREESAKRLAAFKKLTDKFKKMIDSGKLDVIIRDGRMVVKLPAGILFDSGSSSLSRDGELALMEVAIVLRQFTDRKFMVEGHTDNRPLESAADKTPYRNNWELSTARAVTVIEFLIEAKMHPQNLLAAGHGEFDPVGDNNTNAGRQENRRIEIVLLPNVQELPALPAE